MNSLKFLLQVISCCRQVILNCLSLMSEMRAPAVYIFIHKFSVIFQSLLLQRKLFEIPTKRIKNSAGLRVYIELKDRKKYLIDD